MTRLVKKRRLKKKKQKGFKSAVLRKLLLVLFFTAIVFFSLCSAGYVIFFRTVFAREPVQAENNEIVFEEPDPPSHEGTFVKKNEKKESFLKRNDLPKVAIIIDDLGYQEGIALRFLDFPVRLTYSFLPYAPYTEKLERIAFYSGKTVLLHLPLEPRGKEWDPGPGAIFLADSREEQKKKFERALAFVPHSSGVNNHMGSLFTSDDNAMENILKLIQRNGMFFVDSFTSAESKGIITAKKLGIKHIRRNVFLDNELNSEEICNQLEKLVNIALLNGFSVGIAHPHEETVDALVSCSPKYKKIVKFVSVMELVH